jgi:hypothetical protein
MSSGVKRKVVPPRRGRLILEIDVGQRLAFFLASGSSAAKSVSSRCSSVRLRGGQSFDSCDEQRSNLDAISGSTLGPLFRRRFGIAGIKALNLILPHLHEDTGG